MIFSWSFCLERQSKISRRRYVILRRCTLMSCFCRSRWLKPLRLLKLQTEREKGEEVGFLLSLRKRLAFLYSNRRSKVKRRIIRKLSNKENRITFIVLVAKVYQLGIYYNFTKTQQNALYTLLHLQNKSKGKIHLMIRQTFWQVLNREDMFLQLNLQRISKRIPPSFLCQT